MNMRYFYPICSALAIARGCIPFDGLVEDSSEYHRTELEAQVPDEQQQSDAHRPSLSALVVDVDVRDGTVRARLVGCPAKFAGNRHTFKKPTTRNAANMGHETGYKRCRA